MKNDIKHLIEEANADDLSKIVDTANDEIRKRKDAAIASIVESLSLQAESNGLTINEVCKRICLKSKKTILPMYRNPDNPNETWTGRGRMPRWVIVKTMEGVKKEDMLIAKKDAKG